MTDDRPDYLTPNEPRPPAETAGVEIDDRLAPLKDRKAEILAAFDPARLVVVDNDTIGRTADKISIARAWLKRVDGIRSDVKAPYDAAAATVQSRTATFIEDIVAAVGRAEDAIRDCRSAMRRKSEEAAAAQAAEIEKLRAAAAAPEAPLPLPPAPPPSSPPAVALPVVRGDYGSKVSEQGKKIYTIANVRELPDEILDAPAVRKAMLAAVKQLGRLKEDIPGVSVSYETGDKIRRVG